ncbi:MAG: hypothetical protein V3U54_02320, partial [Thermodesulfobacteriota bacterium]
PFSLAYQAGLTFPTSGNDAPWRIEPGGLILTKNFNENLSIDADFVFALIEDDSWSLVSEVGIGYFVKTWFQPVLEFAYSFENVDREENITILNLTAGFTSPVNDWLTIIIGVTPDLYTKNTDDMVTFTAAFTFLF